MTKNEFDIFWTTNYPRTIPLTYCFKHDYPERWFRIHSLPESKRYAESNEEWEFLLSRQNEIIADLLGDNTPILLVTGEYYLEDQTTFNLPGSEHSLSGSSFIILNSIDLYKLHPDEFEEGQIFIPMFCNQIWNAKQFDKLLIDIAQDKLRAFFVSIENKCIIAPYDGGIDFIVTDIKTRDFYKNKYKSWLSSRTDGM